MTILIRRNPLRGKRKRPSFDPGGLFYEVGMFLLVLAITCVWCWFLANGILKLIGS